MPCVSWAQLSLGKLVHIFKGKSPNGTVKYISPPPAPPSLIWVLSCHCGFGHNWGGHHHMDSHGISCTCTENQVTPVTQIFILCCSIIKAQVVCVFFTLKFGTSAHTFLSTELHRKIDEMCKNEVYSSCNFKTHQKLVLGL